MELKELFLRIFYLAKAEPIIALLIAGIIAISGLASIVSILIGYHNWPPKFSYNWIIGALVTIGFFIGTVVYARRLLCNGNYSFVMNDKEIIIRDWGTCALK